MIPEIAICTFVVLFGVVYKPPHLLIDYIADRNKKVLFSVKTEEPVIALSIDDAPTRKDTLEIANYLNDRNAKATFFVIGDYINKLSNGLDILRELMQNGHELGNHAMYDRASIYLQQDELGREIQETEAIMAKAGWKRGPNNWFRPGSGFFSDAMIDTISRAGLRTVLGSVYPHDPMCSVAWINAIFILTSVRNGDIIIIHDRPWTLKLLEIIVPRLQKRGFKISTIGELVSEGKSIK
jgi:peptidoglycan/xylan/chitin deacetylase (PgdA/CDA1 family)